MKSSEKYRSTGQQVKRMCNKIDFHKEAKIEFTSSSLSPTMKQAEQSARYVLLEA